MDWEKLSNDETLEKTKNNLEARGMAVKTVATKEEALDLLTKLIPEGSDVMVGGSTTLKEIGFVELLSSKNNKWKNVRGEILAEKDPAKQAELRKRSILSEYFIGSVQAVTTEGQILAASATGSQFPSYAFSSNNVIWVVGTQKIVKDVEEGLKRLREYCLVKEDARMKAAGMKGSSLNKILILEREFMPFRKLTVLFVKENLGF